MADNYTQRPNRQSDPYARTDSSAAAPGNDPLAELARLIGQTDPFGEFGRDARRAQAAPQSQSTVTQQAVHRPAPAASEWGDAPPLSIPSMPLPGAEPRKAAPTNYASQPAYAPAAQPAAYAPAAAPQPPAPMQAYGFDADPAHQGDAYQAYDAAAYGQQPAADAGYEADPYYQHTHTPSDGDDIYDDAPPPRRRRIVLMASVAALVVLGVAGAWGYRSMFGPSGSSAPPPVIKADTTPSKIVPPQNGDSGNGKQIYDRIGDRSQGEKLVSREETPVEVKPAPRVVFPGPAAANPQPAPAAPAPVQAQMPAGINALASTEPKKIKTIPIRPDMPDAAVAAPVRPPVPAATRTAAVAPAPVSDAAPGPSMPPAPTAARPGPVHQAPVQQAEAEAPGNAPLSLSPGAKTRAQAPAPARLANAPAAAAPAPAAASGGPGAYVQVSSQRSEAEAQSAFRSIAAKYPSVLGNRQPVIRRADIPGKGTYYRATVGPFASSEQAVELCSSLKAAGGDCLIQKN
jgi:hypothetical protein